MLRRQRANVAKRLERVDLLGKIRFPAFAVDGLDDHAFARYVERMQHNEAGPVRQQIVFERRVGIEFEAAVRTPDDRRDQTQFTSSRSARTAEADFERVVALFDL